MKKLRGKSDDGSPEVYWNPWCGHCGKHFPVGTDACPLCRRGLSKGLSTARGPKTDWGEVAFRVSLFVALIAVPNLLFNYRPGTPQPIAPHAVVLASYDRGEYFARSCLPVEEGDVWKVVALEKEREDLSLEADQDELWTLALGLSPTPAAEAHVQGMRPGGSCEEANFQQRPPTLGRRILEALRVTQPQSRWAADGTWRW